MTAEWKCPHGYSSDWEREASCDEDEISSCCAAPVSFFDDGYGGQVLACKCCYARITAGYEIEAIVFEFPDV